jgi:hypothetical protein
MRFATIPLLLALASCASIMNSGPDLVPVDSIPPGATIMHCGNAVGVTPATVSIGRRQSAVLTLMLDGYHNQAVEVATSVNAGLLGNLLFGGLVGLMVDGATGNAKARSTQPLRVPLTPLDQPPPIACWKWKPPSSKYDDENLKQDFWGF